MTRISVFAPGLTPREIRRLRFPTTHDSWATVRAREDRLVEIAQLIAEGYSRPQSIALELKKEIHEKTLAKDLRELKKRGEIRLVSDGYWVPRK